MMTFTNARESARWIRFQVEPILQRTLGKSQRDLDAFRFFLRIASERLYDTCTHFETAGGAEEFEELYLPVFDALSHLNYALSTKTINADSVRAAHACMDILGELIAAVPAA